MYGTEEEVWGCLLIMPDCWGLRLPEVRPYLSPDRLWEESDVDRVCSEWLEAPRVFGPRRRAVNYRINKRTVEITCGIADFIFPRREVSWRETPWPCPNIRLWYHCFIQQRVKTVKMVLALTYPRVRYPYTKASSRPAFLYITKERRNKLKWERFTVLKEGGLTGEGRGGEDSEYPTSCQVLFSYPVNSNAKINDFPTRYPILSFNLFPKYSVFLYCIAFFAPKYSIPRKKP